MRADDPIASLSRDNPRHVAYTLQALARFRLEHRGARAPAADLSGRPDINLIDAVTDFRRWLSAQPVEPKTLELIGQLETLADHLPAASPRRLCSKRFGSLLIRRACPACGATPSIY